MTLALTGAKAWGIEAEEPRNNRYMQYLRLVGTGANTDVTYDLGAYVAGSLGTYWNAVDGSEPGDSALKAIRDICSRAQAFLSVGGIGLSARQMVDASRAVVQSLTSAAYGGGSATPTLTVTGLLTTDTILTAQQRVANANSLPLIGHAATCATNDQFAVTYSADPGATGTVKVVFSRATTTPEAGTYTQALTNGAPDIVFASGDAPTAIDITLCWLLKDGEEPVALTATSSAQTGF